MAIGVRGIGLCGRGGREGPLFHWHLARLYCKIVDFRFL